MYANVLDISNVNEIIRRNVQQLDKPVYMSNPARFFSTFSFLEFLLKSIRSNLGKKLDNLNLLLMGVAESVKNFNSDDSSKELPTIENTIKSIIWCNEKLQKAEYLGDDSIKRKMRNCLDRLYIIEARLTDKSVQHLEKSKTEKELINSLSTLSNSAMISSLLKTRTTI